MGLVVLIIFAALSSLGISFSTGKAIGQEEPSVISYREDYIELSCDVYTNTEKALDLCVKANRLSGVRVFQATYAEHGLIYPVNWEFCDENEPFDMSGVQMNPCQM